jgi:Asp-tRNA(Asn)/Glu-tRNA(Gln) amidotransferase A subunit family amidase
MLDALVGADDIDRYSLPKPNYHFFDRIEEKPIHLKIGYAIDIGNLEVIHYEVEKSVIDSVKLFEQFDWSVEKSNVNLLTPKDLLVRGKVSVDNYAFPWWVMWTYGLGYFLKSAIDKHRDIMDPELVETAEIGYTFSPEIINLAEIQREIIYDNICRHFKNYDILVTPTLATPAFELGVSSPDKIDGKKLLAGSWTPYTQPFNMSGHPAATIPCGWSREGLPMGLQIIGKRLDDLTVLQVSKAFEEIAPWQDKRPNF